MNKIAYFIIVMGIVNMVRMLTYLISSDIYSVKEVQRAKRNARKRAYKPMVSVIVPAHNEGSVIKMTLESLQARNYPKNKMEIIVVNDGSTDNTQKVVKNYIETLRLRQK